jgi:hypothetical protein
MYARQQERVKSGRNLTQCDLLLESCGNGSRKRVAPRPWQVRSNHFAENDPANHMIYTANATTQSWTAC